MSVQTPNTDSTMPDTDLPELGTQPLPEIRGFRLLRVINHGGMSIVYLGEQLALSREVAIKVMLPQALSDEVSRRRFENEVRTIARLEHPHVVRIYELGRTEAGLPYFTMPHLARGHLGQRSYRTEAGLPDEARVIEILRALMSALEYAHARGIVHRDVKAENVLFDDNEQPLLADFGIALRRGFGPRVTAAGLAVGSTAYMAPEQARGEDVDGRADLYSLGVLTWELLTGQLPYRAADALSMAVMHAQDPIPKLPQGLRHWQRFINRALAKSPADRFDDVAQMREAMEQIARRHRWPMFEASHDRLAGVAASVGRLPRPVWAGVALFAMVAIGAGLLANGRGDDGFFRVGTTPPRQEATAADPTASMLRPPPQAPVQVALEQARRQITQRNLTAPEGDNAVASVMAAWQASPDSSEVQAVIAQLTDALGREMLASLGKGNDTRAREYFGHATRLAEATRSTGSDAQVRLREHAGDALLARVVDAAEQFDHTRAEAAVTLARDLQVPEKAIRDLVARADAIPRRGQVLPNDPAGAVLGAGGVAISRRPVSVGEYARFANATGREAARCRERASLLRVFDPRGWRDPGFSQGEGEPVVCVSIADAEAYAAWYSRQTGHHYRLPSATESRQTAAEISGRDLSLWLSECGRNCDEHHVRGTSWRSKQSQRALAANRGFDDVGFRLARDL